jgi:uncharacterized UPF0160 family protein
MKLLLDENIDVRFKLCFDAAIHEVYTVRDMKWNGVKNGKLLKLAIEHQFEVFICVDKNLPYQQNLTTLGTSVVVIDVYKNVLPNLKLALPNLLNLLKQPLDNQVYTVKI